MRNKVKMMPKVTELAWGQVGRPPHVTVRGVGLGVRVCGVGLAGCAILDKDCNHLESLLPYL